MPDQGRAGETVLEGFWNDVRDVATRLAEKAVTLDELAVEARTEGDGPIEVSRLRGKAEGVRLALSFIKELLR